MKKTGVKKPAKPGTVNLIMLIAFAALLLISVAFTVYAVVAFDVRKPILTGGVSVDFSEGWTAEGKAVSLPESFEKNQIDIVKKIPVSAQQRAVMFRLTKCRVRAYADGNLIYENGFDDYRPFGNSEGYSTYIIKLPVNAQSLTIHLESTDGGNITAPKITYGTATRLLWQFIISKAPALIFFALGIVFSVSFFIVSLNYGRADKTCRGCHSSLYLACFVLLSAWWVFTDSGVAQLLDGSSAGWYITCVYSFRLLPVPLVLYAANFCPRSKRQFDIMAGVFLANALLTLILQVTNTLDASSSLFITIGLMLAGMLVAIGCFANEIIRYKNKELRGVISGFIVVILIAAFGFADYYILNLALYSYAYMVAIVIFVVQFAVMAYKRLVAAYKNGMKSELYKELAFTDIMTGLKNRTAYEEDMKRHEAEITKYDYFSIAVFDINGLKYINDNFGHEAGDMLIKRAARVLMETVGDEGGVYRIGGDEFAAVVTDKNRGQLDEKVEQLIGNLKAANENQAYELQLSAGIKVIKPGETKNISVNNVFTAADDEMYKNKKEFGASGGNLFL